MTTQGDREPDAESNFPPGLGKNDQFLYREIEKVNKHMNEIIKSVDAIPAGVDAKIEPVNSKLTTIVQAIEAFAKLPETVEKIRQESAAFRSFRDRIEGHEDSIKILVKKNAWKVIRWVLGVTAVGVCAVVGGAFYLGSFLTTINGNVGEMKDSVGEIKNSVGKLEAATYELNGTTKGQSERLKVMEEQLKTAQASMRETAKTAAEASDKASERIAGALKTFEKRTGKSNEDLGSKIDAVERKIEETSNVLVLSFTLTPEDKPDVKSETHLIYEMRVPPEQRRPRGTKAFQAGAVSFFDGSALYRPSGVVATAYPKGEDIVQIELFFQDKSAIERFRKWLTERRVIRLRITFALG
jgi:uncharacterized protein YoxC